MFQRLLWVLRQKWLYVIGVPVTAVGLLLCHLMPVWDGLALLGCMGVASVMTSLISIRLYVCGGTPRKLAELAYMITHFVFVIVYLRYIPLSVENPYTIVPLGFVVFYGAMGVLEAAAYLHRLLFPADHGNSDPLIDAPLCIFRSDRQPLPTRA